MRSVRPGVLGYFVRHGTAANLVLAIMMLMGLFGLNGLRAQLYPDVVINAVTVSVDWPGAGPEQVDSGVVQLLEPALQEVDGVEEITSVSRERRAVITLEFEPGYDMTAAAEGVTAAVNAAARLPDGTDPPVIRRRAWSDPVTDVAIHGPVDHAQLGRLADELSDRLRAAGMTRVDVQGAPAPDIRVAAPEAELIRHDLTLSEIAQAVGDAAASDPGGQTGAGSRVSTGAERRSIEALGDVIVRTGPDGSKLRLREVARIEDAGLDTGRRYYVEGEPGIVLRIRRGENGDSLAILDAVKATLAEMEPTLPAGVEFDLIHTYAGMIEERLGLLTDNALTGLVLVLAVLFLFLNARTALWVAAGIPSALLAAAGVMWALGMSLNLVSIFALILTLGIVVDDAIVVGEHADHLARRRGLSPTRAAEQAAKRMAGPVFASALTTVCAFAAMLAIGGRFGKTVEDMPMVVSIVLLASLVECFLILPNHMKHAVSGIAQRRWYDAPSRWVNRGFEAFRERAFRPAMGWIIRLRYPVLGLAVMLLLISAGMLTSGKVPWRFWSAPEANSIVGNVAMLAGAEREDTLAQIRMMEETVREVAAEYEAEHGLNPVRFMLSEVGGNAGRGLQVQESKEPWQLGSVGVELIDGDLRPYTSWDFNSAVQARLTRHPLAEVVTFRGERGGPGGDSLSIGLSGDDPARLKAAAETLKGALAAYPEITGVEDSLAYDKTELLLELTPLGEALGFTSEALGAELRARLTGITAAEYAQGGRAASITVRLPKEELTADFLHRTQVRTPEGLWAPLSELVEVTARPGFATLRRVDGIMSLTVTGELDDADADRGAEIRREIETRILPDVAARHDVGWTLTGLAEQEREFLSDAGLGFVAAVAGIYLILAWIFASWTRPLAVLAVVPFGLVGAVWGHHWWDVPLSMFSIVGLIGMTGIIINDSIVLVTTIDEYAKTRALRPALLDAVCDRLRPVLLTTLTTVVGLAPMLFETSQQAQFLKPTVITLCFGLGFGFFLVLMVTPALVTLQRDVAAALTSARRMARHLRRPRRGLGRA